jgi:hypothetical protein
MSFQVFTNMISQASRAFAQWLFIIGLMLVGFGLLVYWLRDIFAFIAAGLFVFAGFGCAVTAVKIYFAQRRMDKMSGQGNDGRENVRIRFEEHYDGENH